MKMGETICMRLSAGVRKDLELLSREEKKDKSQLIRELLAIGMKERKIEKAIQLYKEGKITLWKAARLCDLSLWEMIKIVQEKKIEAQYGMKELERDLKALE